MIDTISAAVKKAFETLHPGIEVDFSVEYTDSLEHGHITCNVSMVASKQVGKMPRLIAEALIPLLQDMNIEGVESYAVAGPGFLNVTLSRGMFADYIKKAQTGGLPKNKSAAGREVLVEYTDPNPFKEFHIGHLMANAVGESLAGLYEAGGATVHRVCYQGDVGPHIAKALWGLNKMVREDGETEVAYIGRAYAYGATQYEDSPEAKKEIDEVNAAVYAKSDAALNEKYTWGRAVSLAHFDEIYKILGTKFEHFFFESEVAAPGTKIVRDNMSNGVFEESDGAVIYRGEKKGLHTRVFITSKGLPTYETKELALDLEAKPARFTYDTSVIVTANEQNDFFKVVLAAMEDINAAERAKIRHISHGLMRFKDGKMSSRKGTVVTGESLIEDTTEALMTHFKTGEWTDEEKQKTAQVLAVASIKYVILRQSPGSDIVYDREKSVSLEGDSGPYVLYSLVRAHSLLAKAATTGAVPKAVLPTETAALFEMLLPQYAHVLRRSLAEHSPNTLLTYGTKLAAAFNAWYGTTKVIDEQNPYMPYQLATIKTYADTMTDVLQVLGIPVVERM